MAPRARTTRAFTAYGEQWTVTRHPPQGPRTSNPGVDPGELPPGELAFISEGGERRRLSVPHENSFPTQDEFDSMPASDFTRLLEKAVPD